MNDYNNSGRVIEKEVIHTPDGAKEHQIEHEKKVVLSPVERRQRNIHRIQRIIYFIVNIISIFILIRFFFVLVGVDPQNTFAVFLYGLTTPFLAPFLGLFGDTPSPTYGQNIIETADLVAIGIYHLFAWIGAKVLVFAYPRPQKQEHEQEQEQKQEKTYEYSHTHSHEHA